MPPSQTSQPWVIYILFGVLTALFLFTTFGDRGLLHLSRLREEKKKLDDRNFVLQKENELLRERIYRLRHDNFYLEKSAREELGLTRPGEIVYRFSPSEAKSSRSQNVSPDPRVIGLGDRLEQLSESERPAHPGAE